LIKAWRIVEKSLPGVLPWAAGVSGGISVWLGAGSAGWAAGISTFSGL